jgi:hypothetical protein
MVVVEKPVGRGRPAARIAEFTLQNASAKSTAPSALGKIGNSS